MGPLSLVKLLKVESAVEASTQSKNEGSKSRCSLFERFFDFRDERLHVDRRISAQETFPDLMEQVKRL